jgi:hypothetical protein
LDFISFFRRGRAHVSILIQWLHRSKMTAAIPVEIGGVISAKPEGQQWSSG